MDIAEGNTTESVNARRKNRPALNINTIDAAESTPPRNHFNLGRPCYSARIPESSNNRSLLDTDEVDFLAAAAPTVPLTPQYRRTPTSPSGNLPAISNDTDTTSRSEVCRALNMPSPSNFNRVPPSFLETITPTPTDPNVLDLKDINMPPPHVSTRHHGADDNGDGDIHRADSRITSPTSVRDSHDLSLPHRQVRDSLVANMLLSLDQFSMDQMQIMPTPSHDAYNDNNNNTNSANNKPNINTNGGGGRSMTMTSTRMAPTTRIGGGGGPSTGGGHQYSYSSDYEGGDESVSGSRLSRGRRSNSSSGFQSSLGRINSMRETNQRSQPSTPQRQMHSRGERGSKSSSTSSINAGYAQVLGSQRWAHGFGGRSSSFDHGQKKPSLSHQPGTSAAIGVGGYHTGSSYTNGVVGGVVGGSGTFTSSLNTTAFQATGSNTTATRPFTGLTSNASSSPWHIEFSDTFFSDDYDAAPTPTIPSGPRRFPLPISPQASSPSATRTGAAPAPSVPTAPIFPSYPRPPLPLRSSVSQFLDGRPKSPALERMKSTRSARSIATSGPATRDHPSMPPNPLPTPRIEHDAAPAPHVGYEKSKDLGGLGIAQAPPPPVKEKQGFFRRVFGIGSSTSSPNSHNSSSNNNHNNNNNDGSHGGQTSSPGHPSPTSINSHPKLGSLSTPPSRDSHSRNATGHVLQKKPSSFFRRRKKSITADDIPPVPSPAPVSPAPETGPSPISAIPPPIRVQTKANSSSINNNTTRDLLSVSAADPSPVSSLRRVMNPYLNSPTTPNTTVQSPLGTATPVGIQSPLGGPPQTQSPSSVEHDGRPRARGFSPDYEPPSSATIRSINTDPIQMKAAKREDLRRRATDESPLRRLETPTRDPAGQKNEPDGTFLHDNSDNEPVSPTAHRGSRRSNKTKKKGKHLTANAAPSSPPDRPPPIPDRASSRETAVRSPPLATRLKALPSPSTDGEGARDSLALPIEGARSNRSSQRLSQRLSHAASLPSLRIEGREMSPRSTGPPSPPKPLDEPEVIVGEPSEDDKKKARRIFNGNEDFIQKDRAAAWMGEEGLVRQRTLKAYMELYDFGNRSILAALREVCGRLVLRGETQQVDRILVAFSSRWCECNPNHGLKAMDIIHTICYSIMLLNTDLHMADIEHKMTRSQFIKNTMGTVQGALEDSAPDAFEKDQADARRPSGDYDKKNFRLSLMPPARPVSGIHQTGDKSVLDDCGPLVRAPFEGTRRAWGSQLEHMLKDIYNSIRDEKLPLFGADPDRHPLAASSQSSLSVMNVLKRTPSVLSKAPSEGGGSNRGRMSENRNNRWVSKSRSRPRGFGAGMNSSRTSFDDNNSVWSPTVSSATWSKYSLGRTQTSMSMDSFGSSWPRPDYQHSIGFATALSQAIIREEALGSGAASLMSEEPADSVLLEDESLELAGPPWVKEGIVTHKHHLDGIDKKAKDRNWSEVFAVVQKGCLSLFSFHSNKSLGRKSRLRASRSQNLAPHGGGVVVGGGNWQDNATNLGTFNLRQTLASILPPPGYSRTRPHVWALSLPTGAVHLFQVGTPEICKEFVTSSNYWSARLSTHPLVGGISNIEYGWSDSIVNNALVAAINDTESTKEDNKSTKSTKSTKSSRPGSSRPGSSAVSGGTLPPMPPSSHSQQQHHQGHRRRSSAQSRSSLRSSIDHAVGRTTTAVLHGGGKLPGDRVTIPEWMPPQQSMRPSNSAEKEQLTTLQEYVRGVEEELQIHNQLRSPMLLAFTPRGHNAAKAMQNWERKSSYLLREIVKFRTYVDVLVQAESRKEDIYKEREGVKREVTEALGMEFPMPGNGTTQSAPVSGVASLGGSGRASPRRE